MKTFSMVGVIQRTVVETFVADVDAANESEAQDVFYEILSDYPDSEFKVKRLQMIRREGSRPVSVAVEFQNEELADPKAEITEKVFDNDDDGPEVA